MSNELEQIKQKQKEIDELIARLGAKQEWMPSSVDQPVYVRNSKHSDWELRFVAEPELKQSRDLACWDNGNTSLTTGEKVSWKYWKPATDIIITPNWLPNTGVMPDRQSCVMRLNNGIIADSTNPLNYIWDITHERHGIKEYFILGK